MDYNTIISDAYGNSGPYAYGSSAYMLIYQKRTKKIYLAMKQIVFMDIY